MSTDAGVGIDDDLDGWITELAHRADDVDAVRAALLARRRSAADFGALTNRLCRLDPLRDRPLLSDDPDAAVVVDILLTPLAAPPTDYVRMINAVAEVARCDKPRTLGEVERLLAWESLYATPECRVRLEGRGRYNLAFHAARLRAGPERTSSAGAERPGSAGADLGCAREWQTGL
jgi:predicted metal-dependent HD superfamily phosphohydrolase